MQQTYKNKSFTGQERILQLPYKKAFNIALQSIRVRFWRSMVTAAGILLGIAFLATILVSGAMDNAGIERGLLPKPDPEALAAAKSRSNWLVGMSLIVVTVGIANSMLMSVTERFKEIGTMKCLGALDSFVQRLFMLEAAFLGIIASTIGWVIGTAIMVIAGGFSKGWPVVAAVGLLGYLKTLIGCIGLGMLLTLAATFFPALRAAKMPPVMALRSEI